MTSPANPDIAVSRPEMVLKTVGGLQVFIGDEEVLVSKSKALALLTLLAIEAPFRVSRAVLRGLLWSDVDETLAQNSLRNTLWFLKNTLERRGFDGIQASRAEVWLDADRFTTDLHDKVLELSNGRVDLALLPQEGFPGSVFFGVQATDLFDQRLNFHRESVKNNVVEVCQAASSNSDHVNIGVLELLVALQPTNETHYRTLIQCLVRDGRKADALTYYQALWHLLDEEFGEEPSIETQDIIVALKQEAETNTPVVDGKPTVVVHCDKLPAASAQQQAEMEDLRALVLSALVRFREWRVVDETYVPDLGALVKNERGLVAGLTVSATLATQSVQDARCVLTDLSSGQVLWSERLRSSAKDNVLSLDDTVRHLATSLNLHLSGPTRPQLTAAQDSTRLHYEQWAQSQVLLCQFTQQSWQEAEEILDQILAENDGFVRALSSRASIETMRQIAFPGVISTQDLHRRALAWASNATRLDSIDSRAQLALGWACAMARQFDRAELAYELAFQNNENDPWTIVSSAVGFAFCGQNDRAGMLLDYLNDLDLNLEPVHWSYVATTEFLRGNYETCVQASERAEEISCDVPAWHAAALAHLGKTEEATQIVGRFLALSRGNWKGTKTPSEAEVFGWLLSCFPIKERATWNQLREGLTRTGARVAEI